MKKLLEHLWVFFDRIPEGVLKTRLRFFLAFSPVVPNAMCKMSPIRASTHHYLPKKGDVVVDGGAFPGDFTIFVSRKIGDTGKVLSFEPNPKNFEILKKQVETFGCHNVILVKKGLWDKKCKLKMAGQGVDASIRPEGEYNIELVTLDDELERVGIHHIDFIKFDIEGAEVMALRGAERTLQANSVRLAIGSYHEFEGRTTQQDIENILASWGYKFITEYPERLNTYAWKQ